MAPKRTSRAQPGDPVRVPQAGVFAAPLAPDVQPKGWYTGTTVDHSPVNYTYQVTTPFGTIKDVLRLVRDPGESGMLPDGTTVVIHEELGYPVIDSVLKQASTITPDRAPARVTEQAGIGGDSPLYAAKVRLFLPDTDTAS